MFILTPFIFVLFSEMAQVEQKMMSNLEEANPSELAQQSSQYKMSTSESEQSLDSELHPPNRAVIFMKHCSDDNESFTGETDTEPVINSEKFNKNYFTMAYTDNESLDGLNNNDDDWLNTSLSLDENDNDDQEDGVEEEDELNTTLVPSGSAKKSLMKLFSPEKLPLRKFQMENQCEEKLSPMDVSDISSPDSHKSLSEAVTNSISAFSLSEDSLTYIVDCKPKKEDDSLDEISSGEISSESEGQASHVSSQNISDYWDEVSYFKITCYDASTTLKQASPATSKL